MAARYLNTGGGSVVWDASDTSIWSASSGGATGASVPGSGDTVIMDAASGGGTVTLGYSPTVTSITCGAFTGTLDFATYSPTMASFSGTGTGTRTIKFGTGTLTLTGNNAFILDFSTTTNLTFDAQTSTIDCTYSGSTGTRTFSCASGGNTLWKIKVSAGSDIFGISNNMTINEIDFTGFTGSWANVTTSLKQHLTLGAGMTVTSGTGITFFVTTAAKSLTSNGVLMQRAVFLSATGGTLTLQDDLTMTSDRTLTISAGTFDANDKNVTTGLMASSGTSVRVINMKSGTWTLSGTGTVWNCATTTNLTLNRGTSTIKLTDTSATAKTFSGGGLTYYNLWYANGAGGASLTFIGSNTFNSFRDTSTAAHTLTFTAGTTQTMPIGGWLLTGKSGAVITMASTAASAYTLTFTGVGTISVDYMSISYCTVSLPDKEFFAGANSTDGGNNTRVYFTVPTLHRSNFFMFM